MNKMVLWLMCGVATLAVSGCGRPPSAGGPPDDYSVNAVVAAVSEERVEVTIQLVGSLRARDAIDVVSEMSGTVDDVLFRDGQAVSAGDLLVRLDDGKLRARQAEASARFRLAEANMKRSQELFDSETISQQEVDQTQAEFDVAEATLRLLDRELEDTEIQAPFDGVVSDRRVSPGQFLAVGTPVTRLVQLDPLEVEFRVPERHLSRIELGQAVSLTTVALPDARIDGEVFFIDSLLDQNTRTVLVKAEVANPGKILRPGMFGSLSLVLDVREAALVIPESAIRYSGDQASVVVVDADERAEFRPVTVGLRLPGRAEISDGLTAGERVVIEGFQKMGPGTAIIISPASEAYGVSPTVIPVESQGDQP